MLTTAMTLLEGVHMQYRGLDYRGGPPYRGPDYRGGPPNRGLDYRGGPYIQGSRLEGSTCNVYVLQGVCSWIIEEVHNNNILYRPIGVWIRRYYILYIIQGRGPATQSLAAYMLYI